MIDRIALIEQLKHATDKAASFMVQRGTLEPRTCIGSTHIRRNKNGFYDIFSLNNKLLFENIMVFDIATIIAQRYTSGEFSALSKVLDLESVYAKHHTDMLHYLHCVQAAKRRNDFTTLAILEDKFRISEVRASRARDSIVFYKRVK